MDCSFIIPAYNEENFIAQTIKALKSGIPENLHSSEIEIVVVDNKSTDQTSFVAKNTGANVIFESNRKIKSGLKSFLKNTTTTGRRISIVMLSIGNSQYQKTWKITAFHNLALVQKQIENSVPKQFTIDPNMQSPSTTKPIFHRIL